MCVFFARCAGVDDASVVWHVMTTQLSYGALLDFARTHISGPVLLLRPGVWVDEGSIAWLRSHWHMHANNRSEVGWYHQDDCMLLSDAYCKCADGVVRTCDDAVVSVCLYITQVLVSSGWVGSPWGTAGWAPQSDRVDAWAFLSPLLSASATVCCL